MTGPDESQKMAITHPTPPAFMVRSIIDQGFFMKKLFTFCLAACLAAFILPAPLMAKDDGDKKEKWDVATPQFPTREVAIDVDEGTWMSLDVSPDGKTIAFDLLGDIYVMPMAGGTAKPIASGVPWEMQPRFSPDGQLIAFTSDRAGGDNIWIMNKDGSDKRQVTKEKFRLLNNPTWSADGQYLAARKHFTTQRSLGAGEIWLYHLGGGNGVKLVKRPSETHQKELGEPIFSADGDYIYYSQNVTSGGQFIYAQDSNTDLFNIKRYEMRSGEISTAASGAGGSVRPAPSPDGKYLAFVRRERMASKLYLKDLHSGEERKIYDDLDRDLQEVWAVHGVYPNMDWLSDSSAIVFWAGGKIRKLNIYTGASEIIPFRVQDNRTIIDPPRPSVKVAPAKFKTKMPRFSSLSPNAKQVVFESLGHLYVKSLPNGKARRLTDSDDREFFPSWSADGQSIVYVAWNDDDLGTIRIMAADGTGARALTQEPGHYRRPRFSPDGNSVVFEKGRGGFLTSNNWSQTSGVYQLSVDNGAMARVTKSGASPHFGAQNDRVFMTKFDGDKASLISVNFAGEDERIHASGDMITQFEVAPGGDYLAFVENYNAYVMPMTRGPQNISAGRNASANPVVKASGDGASYIGWAGAQLSWTLGPQLYSAGVGEMIAKMPKGEPKAGEDESEAYSPPTKGADLSLSVKADQPDGVSALMGAKIITMAGADGGVIENGVIIIEGNKITAIGNADDVKIPDNARQIDLAGKTIIPGLIDAHAHGPQGRDDIIPQQNWAAIAHLALGVTTVHDPSNAASHAFSAAEYQRAGLLLAPRIYSTGEIVYGAKAPGFYAVIDNADDALSHVRRLKAQGAHSIKNYNQPRRDQRQQVIAAALEEDMVVVAEGASLFHMDMAFVADGITSIEHNLPQSMLYEDVLSFFAATKVAYTPTLVVTYGGLSGDSYWRQAMDVWRHPILSQHVPPRRLQASSIRRQTAPEEDFSDQVNAATAKLLADRGVAVSIGAHGQEEGLAAHWEMWSFVRGGMSPLEALKAATITPATHLGFAGDIGSLEKGKLADLVILNSDPLADIGNTDDIAQVMQNGRLYDAKTMNEEVTGDFTRKPYWWE